MKSDAKVLNYVKNSKKTASCFVHKAVLDGVDDAKR